MSDDITPALTAEEWANREIAVRGKTSPKLPIAIDDEGEMTVGPAWVEADERHAIAALALYGQPFGFTHDERRALRFAVTGWAGDAWGGLEGAARLAAQEAHRRTLVSVGDKVEALLPPLAKEPFGEPERPSPLQIYAEQLEARVAELEALLGALEARPAHVALEQHQRAKLLEQENARLRALLPPETP